jgi:hypothetical protein
MLIMRPFREPKAPHFSRIGRSSSWFQSALIQNRMSNTIVQKTAPPASRSAALLRWLHSDRPGGRFSFPGLESVEAIDRRLPPLSIPVLTFLGLDKQIKEINATDP